MSGLGWSGGIEQGVAPGASGVCGPGAVSAVQSFLSARDYRAAGGCRSCPRVVACGIRLYGCGGLVYRGAMTHTPVLGAIPIEQLDNWDGQCWCDDAGKQCGTVGVVALAVGCTAGHASVIPACRDHADETIEKIQHGEMIRCLGGGACAAPTLVLLCAIIGER